MTWILVLERNYDDMNFVFDRQTWWHGFCLQQANMTWILASISKHEDMDFVFDKQTWWHGFCLRQANMMTWILSSISKFKDTDLGARQANVVKGFFGKALLFTHWSFKSKRSIFAVKFQLTQSPLCLNPTNKKSFSFPIPTKKWYIFSLMTFSVRK